MLDLEWLTYFFIAAVGLMILGPTDLPIVIKAFGRWVGILQKYVAPLYRYWEDLSLEASYQRHRSLEKSFLPQAFYSSTWSKLPATYHTQPTQTPF